jgi:hypothetical protein
MKEAQWQVESIIDVLCKYDACSCGYENGGIMEMMKAAYIKELFESWGWVVWDEQSSYGVTYRVIKQQ